MMMTNILIIRFASGGRVHRSSSSPWGHSGMVSHLMKLMEFGDPSIMVSTRDTYFDTDYEFTSDDGL